MVSNIVELDVEKFDDFIKKGIAVIDFWAEWCGPCKVMGPIFDETADELKGRAKFGKVDVESNQSLAQRFGVMSIPTTIFFKDGEQEDRVVGAVPKEDLIERVESIGG
jgi:thioredoxin 1